MNPLFWSIGALVLMVCMVILELFTPTLGGFLLAGVVFSALSVFAASRHSESAAYVLLALNVVLYPLALFCGFHILGRSPMIHRSASGGGVANASDAPVLKFLPGETGISITPLRPAGAARFGNVRVDVLSEGKFIDADSPVRVLRIEGTHVIVEPV